PLHPKLQKMETIYCVFSSTFYCRSICEGIWDQHYLSCTLGKNNLMSLLFTFFLTGAPYTIIHELDQINKSYRGQTNCQINDESRKGQVPKDHGYVCSKEENYRDAHRHKNFTSCNLINFPHHTHYFILCGFEIFLPFICCPQVLCCLLLDVILYKRWFMLIVIHEKLTTTRKKNLTEIIHQRRNSDRKQQYPKNSDIKQQYLKKVI
ncbi:hypothetical protein ACJX0J_026496, partial [Zea mays]